MSGKRSVISDERIQDAFRRGRRHVEVLPGDIVTAQARESAERLNIELLAGPLETPAAVRSDGVTAMRRALYRRHPGWQPPRPRRAPQARPLGKLALLGAGGVGASLAQLAADRSVAREIAICDVLPGAAAALAVDLQHAAGVTGGAARLRGGAAPELIAGADVVVVSAGRPRTPGMSRADLLAVNGRVIRSLGETIATLAPDAVVIVVTNPLDEMTWLMLQTTGFPRARVLGMAGTLDGARFRQTLAAAAGVDVADVSAITLGSHGDEMVPLVSRATIRDRALRHFLSAETIEQCRRQTVAAGAAVVELRKTGSATLAPAYATLELIEHLRGARAGPVPASVRLDGEYGIHDAVIGVPCELGRSGLLDVVELALSDAELDALRRAADAVRGRLA